MQLLIVDDEPIIRDGIKSLIDFDQLGITEVYEAENGEKALEVFKAYQPDIVLADINMPKMNGLEFSQSIKRIKPEVKIALITGYDYFDYAREAIKIGVEDYILKPVSRSDIESLLKRMCDKVKEAKGLKEVASIGLGIDLSELDAISSDYKEQMRDYLTENLFKNDLSLGGLAQALGLSTGYLSGLFKKEFGKSFKEYVLQKRLDKAKILLLSSDYKNYEIAASIGIDDPNYFSAMFKKKIGMSL